MIDADEEGHKGVRSEGVGENNCLENAGSSKRTVS
jgi:hypothetical protein